MIEYPHSSVIQKEYEKRILEDSFIEFVRWVFKNVYKRAWVENWHHRIICKIMEDIHAGILLHVILNLPPRYTKTEIIIKLFPAWCYAKRGDCEFLHLAYSDDLALANSSAIKEIISSEEFQYYWHVPFKQDTTAKKKWKTEAGGEFSAAASGGSVTGFGAGKLGAKEFAGALLVDDPLKPDDASSDTKRNHVNARFEETIISRLNDRLTPMLVVMQRLHEEDAAGFLLDGNTELEFTHINIPAINEDGPSKYDPRNVGEPLWTFKHTAEELAVMEIKAPMKYAGQYQQRPAPREGNIFKDAFVKYYTQLPEDIFYKVHSWDMTFKEKSKNKRGKNKVDFVVGTEWGKQSGTGDIYLFPDLIRAQMGFDKTLNSVHYFAEKHPDYKAILIEDKANGSAIINMLNRKYTDENGKVWPKLKRVVEVEPSGSKEERLESQIPLYKSGCIYLPHPSIAPWIKNWVEEHKVFPNGKNDDQVDSGTQAIEHLDKIGNSGNVKELNKNKPKTFRQEFFEKNRRNRDRKTGIKVKDY